MLVGCATPLLPTGLSRPIDCADRLRPPRVANLGRATCPTSTIAAPLITVADDPDPRVRLRAVLAEAGIDGAYPPEVDTQVQGLLQSPGIDDGDLEDRRALPFVTVDGPGTRDLDQALYVERRGDGFGVQYAIADAAWFVPAGTPLFHESLRRGSSFYLPGESVPMLPRALSEGLVSLGPQADRRAMVFDMTVDREGHCSETRIVRARIHSRHQLTFDHVEAVLTGQGEHPVRDPAVVESLRCLREVGTLRDHAAADRGVVPYRRNEVRVKLLGSGQQAKLIAVEVARTRTESDNAQLSLLCNAEGARYLRDHVGAGFAAQPIYKVHPPPQENALHELKSRIDAVVDVHGLPPTWSWHREEDSLATYVQSLPDDDEHARLVSALSRQTILVNVRSAFASSPAPHHGVGAEVYGRFSAPMREVVGVFLHKEMWEAVEGEEDPAARDEALREQVIEAANRSREIQRKLTAEADAVVIDDLFSADLEHPLDRRPTHRGTVMGMRRGRVYVRLDSPPLDIKVYVDRTGRGYACDELGVRLTCAGKPVCALGDATSVRVLERAKDGRWVLDFA